MILEVAICTIDDRIKRISNILLKPRADVKYLVAYQYTDNHHLENLKSAALQRPDVRVVCMEGRGLSRNRNNALRHATGDVLLIADDDVQYDEDSFGIILRHFQLDDQLDIACFQALKKSGGVLHRYASKTYLFQNRPHGTYFNSTEVAVRPGRDMPRFDERFGLGAPFLSAGEEEIFLFDAVGKGLKVQYFPEVIVRVPGDTTGTKFNEDASVQRSKGAVLCWMHGPFGALLRCLKHAIVTRGIRHRAKAFYEMLRGIVYVCQ